MIPDNILSTGFVGVQFLAPDDRYINHKLDYELGGVGLSDPSEGLEFQFWTGHLYFNTLTNEGTVTFEAPNTPEIVMFTRTGVTDFSFTFDQNMHPFVAFTENGLARYWWFDPTVSQQVFSNLGPDDRTPRCSLDDKRDPLYVNSDIILAYMRNTELYFRAQRDRYGVEYPLGTVPPGNVVSVGMNKGLRFQFAIGLIE